MIRSRIMLVVIVAVGTALAAARAEGPKKLAGVDYVQDLVDDYFEGSERMRFFAAAGVDLELSKEEFAVAARKQRSFVRLFDRWQSAIAFDKNRNGTLDWFEAQEYRQAVRQRVVGLFDTNKDRRLSGVERTAANRWLAARKIGPLKSPERRLPIFRGIPAAVSNRPLPLLPPVAPRPGPVRDAEHAGSPGLAWQRRWHELTVASDADKDGTLSPPERAKLYDTYRREFRLRVLDQWDSDGDGEISKVESKRMRAALLQIAQQRKQEFLRRQDRMAKIRAEALKPKQPKDPEQRRREMMFARFDTNKDGRLDPPEQAAMEAYQDQRRHRVEVLTEARRKAAQEREDALRKWDADGDGKISESERVALVAEHRKRVDRGRLATQFDADRDGRLSKAERAAMEQKQALEKAQAEKGRKQAQAFRKAYLARWDTDADGKLSEAERRAALAAARRNEQARRKAMDLNKDGKADTGEINRYVQQLQKKYDADGDGRLSLQEQAKMQAENSIR